MKSFVKYLGIFSIMFLTGSAYAVESFCPGGSNPDPNVLFCDSFEQQGATASDPETSQYHNFNPSIGEYNRVSNESVDGGHSLQYVWKNAGDVDGGYFQIHFGRNPFGSNIKPTQDFREIYWRFYVKLPQDFVAYPRKMMRLRSFGNSNGAEAMIAHIWADGADTRYLKIDPASGVQNGQLVSTKWNDFDNLTWMGSQRMNSVFPKGEWVCLEGHVRLNDPGAANGVFELYANDQLAASRTGLDWVGTYNAYALNAIQFDNYWNGGASADNQVRYMDAIVVSTSRIGCISSQQTTLRPSPPTNLIVLQ